MKFKYNGNSYDVIIDKKISNKNTYIRVNKALEVKVTTNYFTTNRFIESLIDDNYLKIANMLEMQLKKKKNNDGFLYLGKKYDIVYMKNKDIEFGENKVFFSKEFNVDNWYKKQARNLFLEHLESNYKKFSRKIPHPSLRIRKMTSRWGVCNIKSHVITLNLELIKRDEKYLDYVIIHELSHLVYGDHSSNFWQLVKENMPEYKKYREEMKEF